jgi:hypothetical protein
MVPVFVFCQFQISGVVAVVVTVVNYPLRSLFHFLTLD